MGSRRKMILILLFVGISGGWFLFNKHSESNNPPVNFLEEVSVPSLCSEEKEEPVNRIYVHVCGAVKNEGVYALKEGSRVVDAIKEAGGLQKNAAKEAVNQASLLSDGSQVYIPFFQEENRSPKEKKSSKINLNSATKEELLTLPGVGESKAETILRYRKENGNFRSIEELMNINGIKKNSFEKLKDRITV